VGYDGDLRIDGDQAIARKAVDVLQAHYRAKGIELGLLSSTYRFTDLAIARTVPVAEVKSILHDQPVHIVDTGYAIHFQRPGISKGTALARLAPEMGLAPSDFLAIGDSINDVQVLRAAGIGITVANGHPETKAVAEYVSEKEYGDGFVEGLKKYRSYFRAR